MLEYESLCSILKRLLYCVVLASTYLLALAIASCESPKEQFQGDGAFACFTRHEKWLQAYGAPEAGLADLFDMAAFGQFMPGSEPALTAIVLGKPDEVLKPSYFKEYWVYRNTQGIYWVGIEKDDGGNARYPLYYFPYNTRPESLLPRPVTRHLRLNEPEEIVLLYEWGVLQPGILVVLEHGRVREVVYKDLTELAIGEDPERCRS